MTLRLRVPHPSVVGKVETSDPAGRINERNGDVSSIMFQEPYGGGSGTSRDHE